MNETKASERREECQGTAEKSVIRGKPEDSSEESVSPLLLYWKASTVMFVPGTRL